MDDPYSHLADRFLGHYESLRGVVRQRLIARQLERHLDPPPGTIIDIGGGAGHQSIPLARRGYTVVILDPSEAMLSKAREVVAGEHHDVRRRVKLVSGYGEQASTIFSGATFDAALCHGVLMYLENPAPLIGSMASMIRPGGLISVVAKNAAALALRPALQGRWEDALAVFDADRDVGNLGVTTRGDTIEGLESSLGRNGIDVVAWYGVRVLTDHLGGTPPVRDLDTVLKAEWEAGQRDPYRRVGRLLHVLGRRRET